jgi:SAM-dependent methyltransferase
MKLYAKLLGLGRGKKKIEWLLRYVQGKTVLHLGCVGEGERPELEENWVHRYLDADAKCCLGIDHNEKAILRLRQLGYNVIYGDAQSFMVDNKFDIVIAGDIIEHLEDLKGFFNATKLALKDDGYLLITTPNPWFILRFIRCWLKGDGGANPDHVCCFCPRTLRELLRRYGFIVERLEFGSSEPIFYHLIFLPRSLRHTSIFVAARKRLYSENSAA